MTKRQVSFLLVFLLLGVSGCQTTQYAEVPKGNVEGAPSLSRTVRYSIDEEFRKSPPDCFALPALTGRLPAPAVKVVSDSLSMYGRQYVGVQKDECNWILDLSKLIVEKGSVLFASGRTLDIAVHVRSRNSGKVLWQATHKTFRTAGGVPLDPISMAINTVKTARFEQDREELLSMLHDAFRRVFVTYPKIVVKASREKPVQQSRPQKSERPQEPLS